VAETARRRRFQVRPLPTFDELLKQMKARITAFELAAQAAAKGKLK